MTDPSIYSDLWRYVIATQALFVGLLYVQSLFNDWKHLRTIVDPELGKLYKGRMWISAGVSVIMVAVIQAQLALLDLGFTVRQPIAQLAIIFLFLGWGSAMRRHHQG